MIHYGVLMSAWIFRVYGLAIYDFNIFYCFMCFFSDFSRNPLGVNPWHAISVDILLCFIFGGYLAIYGGRIKSCTL
ncbi:protein of unknown function [Serratia sp. Tan611]|nr:protein of unknown function [Serratia sp. Tan611]